MATTSVKDTDKGLQKVLEQAARLAKGMRLTVGIHGPEGAEPHKDPTGKASALNVAEIGTIHEYGTTRIPARSFVRGWFDENRDKIRETIAKIAIQVVKGTLTPEIAFERMGVRFKAEIQNRISNGIPPELDPKTIARKKSSKPLINTGQLRASINYRVEKGTGSNV